MRSEAELKQRESATDSAALRATQDVQTVEFFEQDLEEVGKEGTEGEFANQSPGDGQARRGSTSKGIVSLGTRGSDFLLWLGTALVWSMKT